MSNFSLELINSEFRVDSRLLASELNHRHRTIFENIQKYESIFNEHGLLPVQTEAVNIEDARGIKYQKFALLNEDQCYFLLTLMRNNELVVRKKSQLVKAFRDARNQIVKKDIARIEGKQVRHIETDAIRDLINYAKTNGSKNADMYYMTITKMTNAALNIDAGQRDNLDARKLDEIKIAETMVKIAISDGLNAGIDYKDIYKLCKDRVSSIAKTLLL